MPGLRGLATGNSLHITVTYVTVSKRRKIEKLPALSIRKCRARKGSRTKENEMRKSSLLLLLFVICVPARAQQPREQERNKGMARSFFEEVLDKGRFDRYAESHAKDFVAHGGDHDATLEEDIAASRWEKLGRGGTDEELGKPLIPV
jgi:hypothetical protein